MALSIHALLDNDCSIDIYHDSHENFWLAVFDEEQVAAVSMDRDTARELALSILRWTGKRTNATPIQYQVPTVEERTELSARQLYSDDGAMIR